MLSPGRYNNLDVLEHFLGLSDKPYNAWSQTSLGSAAKADLGIF